MDRLAYGQLPGIAMAQPRDRGAVLRAYAYVYLEEELRREALIKDWSTFARFLRLAALESGQIVSYFRTKAGVEIDFILEHGKHFVPIEVKWTDNPGRDDARHVSAFLAEHGSRAPRGYVVCRTERPREIAPNVTAIPWWQL